MERRIIGSSELHKLATEEFKKIVDGKDGELDIFVVPGGSADIPPTVAGSEEVGELVKHRLVLGEGTDEELVMQYYTREETIIDPVTGNKKKLHRLDASVENEKQFIEAFAFMTKMFKVMMPRFYELVITSDKLVSSGNQDVGIPLFCRLLGYSPNEIAFGKSTRDQILKNMSPEERKEYLTKDNERAVATRVKAKIFNHSLETMHNFAKWLAKDYEKFETVIMDDENTGGLGEPVMRLNPAPGATDISMTNNDGNKKSLKDAL